MERREGLGMVAENKPISLELNGVRGRVGKGFYLQLVAVPETCKWATLQVKKGCVLGGKRFFLQLNK